MLFSSAEFLFLFLPFVLLLCFLLPKRAKNTALAAVSLLFYAFGEPIYVLLLFFFSLFVWGAGRVLPDRSRGVFVGAVILSLLPLLFFKYLGFFLSLLGVSYNAPAMPLGISFYTFQGLSYLVDVRRGDTPPCRRFWDFTAYLTLFPQLIAGPIVRYTDISAELSARVPPDPSGVTRFLFGLAKKLILANGCGELWQILLDTERPTLLLTVFGTLAYTLQIYFDFSGYSDMAIGLGRLLGFHFPENFNYPYLAAGIRDFWRRWHITLTSFFREYVYFPLGGSRGTRARTYFNMGVVWLLTGLWHGAGVQFLLWGLYWFFLLVLERCGLFSCLPRSAMRCLTLFFIAFGWLIFASPSFAFFKGCLLSLGAGFSDSAAVYHALRFLPLLLLGALFATPLPYRFFSARHAFLRVALPLLLFFLSLGYAVSGSYNPFLYFRF